MWCDDDFFDSNERRALDTIEPFDEWEEFMLFATHYFLLTARVRFSESEEQRPKSAGRVEKFLDSSMPSRKLITTYIPNSHDQGLRRHGAGTLLSPTEVLHQGGYGLQTRRDDADVYVQRGQDEEEYTGTYHHDFSYEVACHTLTATKHGYSVLVGGRKSPDKALQTCYLENRGIWRKIEDLPEGRYRHCAVAWEEGILVVGGKQDSATLAVDWYYWQNGSEWKRVNLIGEQPPPRFGACAVGLSTEFTQASGDQSSALLIGGIGADRTVLTDTWQIDLLFTSPDGSPFVRCWQPGLKMLGNPEQIIPFGAAATEQRGSVWIIGGVSPNGQTQHDCEVLEIDKNYEVAQSQLAAQKNASMTRPLLVGHQAVPAGKDNLLIFGGGANCFSFGTFWNRGIYLFATRSDQQPKGSWKLSASRSNQTRRRPRGYTVEETFDPLPVQRVPIQWKQEFDELLHTRRPAVIEGLSIGPCVEKWTPAYLKKTVGTEREASSD